MRTHRVLPSLRDISPGLRRVARTRRFLAERYLRGSGIEIGALHMPMDVPAGVSVRYIDRLDLDGLRRHYPEMHDELVVAPDVIDDGETLTTLGDGGLDFVVANHFIEHCEDPIGTLASHARVLRDGGVLYMAVPDCSVGIDVSRPRTTSDHLVRDHVDGPQVSRQEHYREWAQLVDLRLGNITAEEVKSHAARLEGERYSIHFHVWDSESFTAFATLAADRFGVPLRVETVVPNAHEFLVVMSRDRRD